jgi:hypothetical protein
LSSSFSCSGRGTRSNCWGQASTAKNFLHISSFSPHTIATSTLTPGLCEEKGTEGRITCIRCTVATKNPREPWV